MKRRAGQGSTSKLRAKGHLVGKVCMFKASGGGRSLEGGEGTLAESITDSCQEDESAACQPITTTKEMPTKSETIV